jgi:toxin ParE1/3/4
VAALERCFGPIQASAHLGSLRFSYELDIPELRVVATRRFPYLVFYIPGEESIDVWRVLHGRRDIHSSLVADD